MSRSNVWLALPSKRPPEEVEPLLRAWRERGYKLAVWRDVGDGDFGTDIAVASMTYPGYAVAVNFLCREVLHSDPIAQWIVAAADDILPDPNHSAEEIARECSKYFVETALNDVTKETETPLFEFLGRSATFGVMQPTGDPWRDIQGRIIERIAGSPWIGREFARRMYGGVGPYWHEYRHCFVDEELQNVAQKLGVFWQRPDLTHHHQHWARVEQGKPQAVMPAFLAEANSPEHWVKYKGIFEDRRAKGFPSHEPIS